MPTRRPTRRQTLALGLGGIALSSPFIGGRKAMAESTPDTVVYVSNAGSKEVHVLAMNRQSGELDVIEKTAVPGTDKPSPTSMPLAVTPDHRFLYAALRSEPYSVASFAIDRETGRLKHLSVAPLADSMAYIVTDRTGRYLLSASYPGSKLAINPIAANGQVDGKTTQVIPTQPKAHCIVVDPSNKYCYATSLGGDIIMQWKFDPATGTLSPNTPDSIATKAGNGPRHLAFHPKRRLLYLITETTARIAGYTIDPATGTLKDIEIVDTLPADFKEQPAAADLHVSPDGRFLYGSERKSSTLAGFRIDDTTRQIVSDRPLPDREDPARLRHRPTGPLSALGRVGFKRDDGSRDRSAIRRAVGCEATPDGRNAKLGRDRRSAVAPFHAQG
jgi:6-phosphogluconolactonase